jgi:hypothetical protein
MGTFLCTSHRYDRSNQSMAHMLTMSQSHLTSYLPDYLPNTAGSIGCSLLYTLATYSLPQPWTRSCFIDFALHGIIIIYCFFWNIQVEFDHGTELNPGILPGRLSPPNLGGSAQTQLLTPEKSVPPSQNSVASDESLQSPGPWDISPTSRTDGLSLLNMYVLHMI